MADEPPSVPVAAGPPVAVRRPYGIALGALVVGGVVALVAAGTTWARGTTPGGLGPEPFTVVGSDLAPGLRAFGLLALAGVLAVLGSRRAERVLVGAVLLVAGAFGAVRTGWTAATLTERVQDWVAASDLAPATSVEGSAWPWAAAVGCALVAVAGLLTIRYGRRWPVRGGRAPDRSAAGAPTDPDAPAAPPAPTADDSAARATWEALDRGEDPTTR